MHLKYDRSIRLKIGKMSISKSRVDLKIWTNQNQCCNDLCRRPKRGSIQVMKIICKYDVMFCFLPITLNIMTHLVSLPPIISVKRTWKDEVTHAPNHGKVVSNLGASPNLPFCFLFLSCYVVSLCLCSFSFNFLSVFFVVFLCFCSISVFCCFFLFIFSSVIEREGSSVDINNGHSFLGSLQWISHVQKMCQVNSLLMSCRPWPQPFQVKAQSFRILVELTHRVPLLFITSCSSFVENHLNEIGDPKQSWDQRILVFQLAPVHGWKLPHPLHFTVLPSGHFWFGSFYGLILKNLLQKSQSYQQI